MEKDYQNSNDENQESNSSTSQLSKGQKIGASVLAVFAILLIFLWSAQLKKSISGPLSRKSDSNALNSAIEKDSEDSEDSEESLRAKDTDNDGLSDWDELYFYKTSPYLEDSDSDGFTDKQEIDNSKDPNCPAGRDCYSEGIVEGDASVVGKEDSKTDSGSLDNLLDQFGVGNDFSSTVENEQIGELFPQAMPADDLRQMLIEYGMDKAILDQFSDEQLLESYQEILGQ